MRRIKSKTYIYEFNHRKRGLCRKILEDRANEMWTWANWGEEESDNYLSTQSRRHGNSASKSTHSGTQELTTAFLRCSNHRLRWALAVFSKLNSRSAFETRCLRATDKGTGASPADHQHPITVDRSAYWYTSDHPTNYHQSACTAVIWTCTQDVLQPY